VRPAASSTDPSSSSPVDDVDVCADAPEPIEPTLAHWLPEDPVTIDAAALLERTKAGERLPDADLQSLADALNTLGGESEPGIDRYTALHALGRGGDPRWTATVERFLDSPDDPMLARLAVQILCQWWSQPERYRDWLVSFARGVAWDDGEVRQMALSSIGEWLRSTPDHELLAVLVAVVTDEAAPTLDREDALLAIARALGQDHDHLPPAAAREPLDSPWSRGVLDAARARLDAG
jgi:hypothetical protein